MHSNVADYLLVTYTNAVKRECSKGGGTYSFDRSGELPIDFKPTNSSLFRCSSVLIK